MSKKTTIKESKEVLAYSKAIREKLSLAKADDGKLDTTEIASVMITTAPSAIKALLGANLIDDEMRDLDEAEKNELVNLAMGEVLGYVSMFVPGILGGDEAA